MKDRINITHSLNLADAAQWQKVGGAKWLRKKLRAMRSIGVEKLQRNRAIRADKASGKSIMEIANTYGVHKSTVRRALGELVTGVK